MTSVIKDKLIHALAEGNFVSGEALGAELGVSRAAISKHIKALKSYGLDIFRVTGKGYRLAQPLKLLSQQAIANQLADKNLPVSIELHSVIDSTNTALVRKISDGISNGHVCIAEYQSEGRGRRGRQWVSPFGSHIYLSMYWQLLDGFAQAMGLSLVVALALKDVLNKYAKTPVQLKWPNDVYLNNKKVAGILTELEGQATGPSHCVIGLGINIKMPESAVEYIDQPWADLSQYTDISLDRNIIVAELITALMSRLQQHKQHGFESMIAEWQAADMYIDQEICLQTGDKQIFAIYRGVDAQGAALIEVDGKLKPMYGGEISLRPVS